MFPVLFSIGPITISTLGFCIALGFFFGSFVIWRKAKQEHFEDDDIFDLIFLSLFGGFIGARLLYVLLHITDFGLKPLKWLDFTYSNQFLWLGFLIGIMYLVRLVSKHKKWNFFQIMDLVVFGIVVGQIFLRIGQFLDGSFVGKATALPWGLVFPGIDGKRHPLQLYDIVLLLFVYYLLLVFDKRYRLFSWYQNKRGEAKPGFLWLSYLLWFSLTQFILNIITVQTVTIYIFSPYQLLLFAFFIVALFVFWLRSGNHDDMFKEFSLFSDNEELKPIREPTQLEPFKRPRRFSRAKGRDVSVNV